MFHDVFFFLNSFENIYIFSTAELPVRSFTNAPVIHNVMEMSVGTTPPYSISVTGVITGTEISRRPFLMTLIETRRHAR